MNWELRIETLPYHHLSRFICALRNSFRIKSQIKCQIFHGHIRGGSWYIMDYYEKRCTRNSFRSWTSLLFISYFRKISTLYVTNSIIFSHETLCSKSATTKVSECSLSLWHHLDTIPAAVCLSHLLIASTNTWTHINSFIFPSNACLFHLFCSVKITLLTFEWYASTTKASSGLLILFCDLWFFCEQRNK